MENESENLEKQKAMQAATMAELAVYFRDLYNSEHIMEVADEIGNFAGVLREKFGKDATSYALWHLIAGSSHGDTGELQSLDYPNFDFPGEYSIEKLLRSLQEKYKPKQD